MQTRGLVLSSGIDGALFIGWGCFISSWGERDARPCSTRVRSVWFERCPASALICVGPGPLGDASGSFSLVLASVDVVSVAETSCVRFTLCAAVVKLFTGCIRLVCECDSCGVRWEKTAQKKKNAQNVFLRAPLRGTGRASTQGCGALLAISSSPLVPHRPADR